MNCKEAGRLLDSYLDNELELSPRLELKQHLSLCPACWRLARERQELRNFVREIAPTDKAPPELRTKVLAALRREQAKQTFEFLRQPWIYAAALFVLSLSLSLNILFPNAGKEASRQAVVRHSHSISADHLVYVASANPQVVKSWLKAKLDFSPPVIAFPAPGYALLGGRVDVIQNHSVATVVYKNNRDVITLFCWPPTKDLLAQDDHFTEGYHVCAWSSAECNYILVSKLSGGEIDEYVDLFRDQVQPGAY
jgi:mycothiol system anti-sigma-R factor